jgi:hypothetical protein
MTGGFFDLIEKLVKANVDFVIVGGFAGTVYGCTCVTQDIDICCDFSPANLLLLQKAISGLHPVHRMTPSRKKLELTEKNCAQFKNLYLDTDLGQLDCLSCINGIGDYQKVKQASVIVQSGQTKLRVLNLDALLEAKKAMNRPRDQEAIRQLKAIKALQKSENK